jgi:hypothetical protein
MIGTSAVLKNEKKTHSSPPERNPPEKNTCGLLTTPIVAFTQLRL